MQRGATPSPMRAGVLAAAVLVSVLLELPSFGADHFRGDELVYLGLSRVMGWDLGDYTVRDVPLVNQFPNALYRAPLFPHPPLYPLLLKLGVSGMLAVGYLPPNFWPLLLIGFAFKGLALVSMHRLLAPLVRRPLSAALGVLLLALCPILSLTSGRLLIDAAFAALLLFSVVRLRRALETDRTRDWAIAGLAFAAFMNTKYQALGFLPVPLLVIGSSVPRLDAAWFRARAGKLAFAAALVLAVGGQHFARLFWTYGTIGMAPWIAGERAHGAFLEMVGERSLGDAWLYLLLVYPLWLAWATPGFVRAQLDSLRARDGVATVTLLALYCLAVSSAVMHSQMRYFAPFACFLLASFTLHGDRAAGPAARGVVATLAALSVASMGATSYLVNVMFPGQQAPDVLPALVFFTPWFGAP